MEYHFIYICKTVLIESHTFIEYCKTINKINNVNRHSLPLGNYFSSKSNYKALKPTNFDAFKNEGDFNK